MKTFSTTDFCAAQKQSKNDVVGIHLWRQYTLNWGLTSRARKKNSFWSTLSKKIHPTMSFLDCFCAAQKFVSRKIKLKKKLILKKNKVN